MTVGFATPVETGIVVVGTGFSGLCMAIRLSQSGIGDFVVLERAEGIGGTWRDNDYPGAACDIPSHLYSFSFEGNPNWSRKYPRQAEIKAYIEATAHKYGVLDYIKFNTALTGAAFDETASLWRIETSQGSYNARVLVLATGGLSEPSIPHLNGEETFAGPKFHSAQWDHSVSLDGKTVAVIGTGASAIQFVPEIAPRVSHLDVYQRTPPWVVPRPDRAFAKWEKFLFRRVWPVRKLYRSSIFWRNEVQGIGIFRPSLMKGAEKMAIAHIRAQVADTALREKITPSYVMGCKRILVSNEWYPALTCPNVSLVTAAISEIRPHSIVTADGVERRTDVLIYGTGFQASEYLQQIDIRGRQGLKLVDAWRDGGEAYLGTSIKQFPNLFTITGPNTGLGHNSMIYMIETNVNQILESIQFLLREKAQTLEVRSAIQDAYNNDLQKRMSRTVWKTGCKSWYQAANGEKAGVP